MEDNSLKIGERTMAEKMTFEDLDAWKQARSLVNGIYALTREAGFGRDLGLSSQLQRAAVSVMTNIAEGFERAHLPEKLQFYNLARSFAGEVRSLLYVSVTIFRERQPRPKLCEPTQSGQESL